MPVKSDREYRIMAEPLAQAGEEEGIVEGYATTFEDPYVLYEYDGVQYKEVIAREALDEADMSDVIMQFDHAGRVFARQSNGTLTLSIDTKGLKTRANLLSTQNTRSLLEDIRAKLITKMSWAFTVAEDEYDKATHTRRILKIKKVYDVSAVSLPANPSTDISARSYFDGVIEAAKQERLANLANKRKKLKLLLEVANDQN